MQYVSIIIIISSNLKYLVLMVSFKKFVQAFRIHSECVFKLLVQALLWKGMCLLTKQSAYSASTVVQRKRTIKLLQFGLVLPQGNHPCFLSWSRAAEAAFWPPMSKFLHWGHGSLPPQNPPGVKFLCGSHRDQSQHQWRRWQINVLFSKKDNVMYL